jgi:hypothetical protein
VTEETKTEETKSEETKSDEPKKTEEKVAEAKPETPKDELKVPAKPTTKPKQAPPRKGGGGWRPSWYRVGMGDLFIGIALLIAGTVVAMRTPTRWYGAFIVGTIETVHGLYLLSKKKT